MNRGTPKYVKHLEDRGIALPTPPRPEKAPDAVGADYAWVSKISTVEGIRWAYNTACTTIKEICKLAPAERQDAIFLSNLDLIRSADLEAALSE